MNNPAREADAPIMARIAKLGIKPGAKFKLDALDADTCKAIEEGVAADNVLNIAHKLKRQSLNW